MPAFYVDQRQRTLLGDVMLVPRRRRLLLGQDGTSADFIDFSLPSLPTTTEPTFSAPIIPADTTTPVTAPDLGLPAFTMPAPPAPAAPTLPPSFFAPSKPIIPARVAQPAPVAPSFSLPSLVQSFFPSQGAMRPPAVAPAPTSWFSQQMISGVPNLYLAIGVLGITAFAMLRSSGRKRR